MSIDARAHRPGSVFTPTWWAQVVRIGLLAGLVFWTALALWPRGSEADLDDLIGDLRAGEVTVLQIDDEHAYGGLFSGPWRDRSDDVRVRWRTSADESWRTFVTHEQPEYHDPQSARVRETDTYDGNIVFRGGRDPVLNAIAAELERLRDDGDSLRGPQGSWMAGRGGIQWENVWLVATWMIVLVTLISGPQPRLATKWAWFWLLNLQFGIGFVLLLLLDAPWARFASHRPEPLPHDQQVKLNDVDGRITGGWAFLLVAFVGGFG